MYQHIDGIAWGLGGNLLGCRSIIDVCEDHVMRNDYDGKENFCLMQHTGVIDINDKFIFEGDFCKVIIPDKNGTTITRIIAEVQYDNASAAFKLGYMTEPNHWRNMFFSPDLTIEVIGNIYETDYNKLIKSYNRDFQIDSIFDEPKQ
jgi:hypothetical protein